MRIPIAGSFHSSKQDAEDTLERVVAAGRVTQRRTSGLRCLANRIVQLGESSMLPENINIAWDEEALKNPPYEEAKALYHYGCSCALKALNDKDAETLERWSSLLNAMQKIFTNDQLGLSPTPEL